MTAPIIPPAATTAANLSVHTTPAPADPKEWVGRPRAAVVIATPFVSPDLEPAAAAVGDEFPD